MPAKREGVPGSDASASRSGTPLSVELETNVTSALQRLAPQQQATCRLFCFHHAGGSAAAFRQWPRALADVDVCAVQSPGRANRIDDPLAASIPALVDDALPAILPLLDRPWAVFGHSMGTAVASALVQRLASLGAPPPVHVFVSGRQPPHRPFPEESLAGLSDEQLLQAIGERYGQLPAEILADRDMLELFLPIFQADFMALEHWSPAGAPMFGCPVTAFGGLDDSFATEAHLKAWQASTRHALALRRYPGGHFYLDTALPDLARDLRADLALSLGSATARAAA